MLKFIILVLLIAIGVWGWQNFNPANFTKENIESKIKQEKKINAVHQGLEKRRLEAEKVMDQF